MMKDHATAKTKIVDIAMHMILLNPTMKLPNMFVLPVAVADVCVVKKSNSNKPKELKNERI